MRKTRLTFLALVMTMTAVTAAWGRPWLPSAPAASLSVFCPELPADCCVVRFIGGCRVCVQTGC